jgi:uncharacterized membrane protein YkoI
MRRMWLAAALLGLASGAAPAEKPGRDPRSLADRAEPRAGVSRITLARGIAVALREVPGEALDASIELEEGAAVIDVTVYTRGRLVDVEVDGETGRVLSVEDEEDDEPPRGQST